MRKTMTTATAMIICCHASAATATPTATPLNRLSSWRNHDVQPRAIPTKAKTRLPIASWPAKVGACHCGWMGAGVDLWSNRSLILTAVSARTSEISLRGGLGATCSTICGPKTASAKPMKPANSPIVPNQDVFREVLVSFAVSISFTQQGAGAVSPYDPKLSDPTRETLRL